MVVTAWNWSRKAVMRDIEVAEVGERPKMTSRLGVSVEGGVRGRG